MSRGGQRRAGKLFAGPDQVRPPPVRLSGVYYAQYGMDTVQCYRHPQLFQPVPPPPSRSVIATTRQAGYQLPTPPAIRPPPPESSRLGLADPISEMRRGSFARIVSVADGHGRAASPRGCVDGKKMGADGSWGREGDGMMGWMGASICTTHLAVKSGGMYGSLRTGIYAQYAAPISGSGSPSTSGI